MSFIDDIGSQNTQLYPIVTIEGSSPTAGNGWVNALEGATLLSTNNITLDHIYLNAYTATNPQSAEGYNAVHQRHFKPLLLNIPSIKESIDIESRKFKISNVSLDISNIVYEGSRFSDIISDNTSLINSLVSIQFVSPTAKMFSTIRPIINFNNTGQDNSYSFYQGYNDPIFEEHPHYGDSGIRAKMTQMIYQGVIRRVSHDDTKVRIELEDLTEKLTHINLPQASIGSGGNILDKYKNKPIPMVYGHVDKSPAVIDFSTQGYKLVFDNKGCDGLNKESATSEPLYINSDDVYLRIGEKLDYIDSNISDDLKVEETWENPVADNTQFELFNNYAILNMKKGDGDNISPYILFDTLYCFYSAPASSWDLSSAKLGTGSGTGTNDPLDESLLIEDDNPEYAVDSDLSTKVDISEIDGTVVWTPPPISSFFRTDQIINLTINATVPSSHGFQIASFRINGWEIILDNISWDTEKNVINIISPSVTASTGQDIIQTFGNITYATTGSPSSFIFDIDDETDALIKIKTIGATEVLRLWKIGANDSSILFQLWGLRWTTDQLQQDVTASIYGTFNNFYIKSHIYPEKVLSNTFYSDIKGRVNESNVLIENPIDIIRDLVVNELGHTAINQAEYEEAKLAHKYIDSNGIENDWKFGFTVSKKINSKKLIEGIAKSTKCFPKFKNDGTFGFNTIKDSYNATDINSAYHIKESDIISYSFKKTKPEQIYRKVTVSYNKDYAQDSYIKTAESDDSGASSYYGIENSDDAHLEFESDYIRHDVDDGNTAKALAQFLAEQYKNDHLVFNLKLPLQYINLEVGSLVKLNLIDDMRALGIDYTAIHMLNGQYRFPVFMITSSTKNLNSVSIECMQLHDLSAGEYQAALDEEAAQLELALQPPVITITGGNQTVQAGSSFTLPTATASDAVDGDLTPHIITSYSDNFSIIEALDSGEAIVNNLEVTTSIQVQFEVTDSSNVTAYANTNINIIPHPASDIFDATAFNGYRTFAINEFHYGGEPETDISGLGNAFWFLFYHEIDAITNKHFFMDTDYYNEDGELMYLGGRRVFKIFQVNGLPEGDNGLYFLAAEFVSAEDSGAFNDIFPNQYASTNDPVGGGANYISVYPNHQLCFQKINMTQNVFNSQTNQIETTIIGDYSNPVVGAWLDEPVIDNTHTMSAEIFQHNVGHFINGEVVTQETDGGADWTKPYVYQGLPLIVGGFDDNVYGTGSNDPMPQHFVGGIPMSETTSIELTEIPEDYNLEGHSLLLGDSNEDGNLNILDIVGTVNFILGTGDLSQQGEFLADFNLDQNLSILDIVGLMNYMLYQLPFEGDD